MLRFIAMLIGFLVGGIPFGYLVAKIKAGIDIRAHGSGNIGATNVGRVLGLPFFFLVFALDFLKGAGPVHLATLWQDSHRGAPGTEAYRECLFLPEAVGLACVLGHLFPIYLNFQGGKGVATTIGVLVILVPWPTAWGLVAWAGLVLLTRMVSIGSIGFAVIFAASYFALEPEPAGVERLGLSALVVLAAILIIVRHRENIRRILGGTESKVRLPWTKG